MIAAAPFMPAWPAPTAVMPPDLMPPDVTPADLLQSARALCLEDFALHHETTPLDQLVAAIRTACEIGFGFWVEPPEQPGPDHRPASHLVEIAFLGVSGWGATLPEAANNWRRAALYLIATENAA